MSMYCNQCEQAAKGSGCDVAGVCGKQPTTSALMDLLTHQLKGIGFIGNQLKNTGWTDKNVDRFVIEALFTTVTNVNFDNQRLMNWVLEAQNVKDNLIKQYPELSMEDMPRSVKFAAETSIEGLNAQLITENLLMPRPTEDVESLRQLILYGLRGMAAYADHALLLGQSDSEMNAIFYEALAALNEDSPKLGNLLELALKLGKVNIRTMELLDTGHTQTYGHPEPAQVSTGTRKGPAIVVSGHDMVDLEALLKQTEGKGINIYTHGEMLPAHGYPKLRAYKHLAGHFGTAWQNQQREFDDAPAAFLFTTNCIQKPKESYADRVFTTGLVGWPGVSHVENRDFSAVIEKALELEGFEESTGHTLTTGFGHNAVLGVADKVIDAVKAGQIRHFFLVGGCDGAKPGRNYYTELVEETPEDTVILTLACGKFRFNHLELGNIGGIPRLLDVGQCNDAYSAVKIAQALADAFECGVNELPLSLILSWYEQKAVIILLSLLALDIRNIRLGPTLPAFITPNVLQILVDNYGIRPISTAEEDLSDILEPQAAVA